MTWTDERERDIPLWWTVLLLVLLAGLMLVAVRVGGDRQCAWLRHHQPVTYTHDCKG